MTPEQIRLVERIRALLPGRPAMREVSMFGGRSIMVNEKMMVSARSNGGLLVRVDADRHDEFLTRPGATQAIMGRDRTMGPGWIDVEADTISSDTQLAAWLEIAMEHNRAMTAYLAVNALTCPHLIGSMG